MRRSSRLSEKKIQAEPVVHGDDAVEKIEEKSTGTPARTGPKSSSEVASSVKRKSRGLSTKTPKRRGASKKKDEGFQEEEELSPAVVVEQCKQLDDALIDDDKSAVEVAVVKEVEEESSSPKDVGDCRKDSMKEKNVKVKRGRRRKIQNEGVIEKQGVSEEASKEKEKEENPLDLEESKDSLEEQELASFQVIAKEEMKDAEVIQITESFEQEKNHITAPIGKKNFFANGVKSTSEERTKEVISCSENEDEPLLVVDTASLKLEAGKVLPGLEMPKKSTKNRTDTIKQTSEKSLSRGLAKKLDLENLKTRLNLSSSKTEGSKLNLLKLTSDAFANLPYKLSKDDLIRKPSKKQSKVDDNADPIDVHNLDIITLNTSEGKKMKGKLVLSSELDARINSKDLYFELKRNNQGPVKDKVSKEDKIIKKSSLSSDLEKRDLGSQRTETMTQKKKKRKGDREETAGPGWYNLPKTEVTDDIKKDLQVLKMRHVLNPKRFYKKGETNMSKYFQIGTVVAGPSEFYSSRVPKKERKRTMVDELLADSEFRRKNKKKYLEIQERKESGGKKYYKKMKNKKKKAWAKD
eukprot:Seg765.4 transcript_id=Seg765.4/GoldUCD/mRNA.D3Y31 product="rRNA-processing protein fcf2" protein_id=Seg765.4/GoldUCD/D3Y31